MIGLETARQLIDFRGPTGALSSAAAEAQLEGAVALHNILESKRVAYLADEVGMGKTYVALGALALFRHFNPRLRLLVVTPRENIQKKWIKELRNFVRNNVRVADLRVKAVHGAPARPIVSCANLAELVRETALNPDRDFFVRLSSFSLPLGKNSEDWRKRREELLDHLPWVPEDFDLRSRQRFKDAYGRALCLALPVFDLVIVDEGHNLKHGFGERVSARNRVMALAFGHPSESERKLPGYGQRARRVLFLSATPLENDYEQLWNQLDVFGLGDVAPALDARKGKDVSEEQKRACAQQFLIRRVTSIPIGGRGLTKNLYRREWHAGGVVAHDHPLEITGPERDRQRLVVALVQKKVSELLGHAKFNNSFQIGMLASFESFLQTAKVLKADDDDTVGTFDDADQTDNPDERLGADVGQVNRLAVSYRRNFDGELPHPKMDALVDHLAAGLPVGRKALVFVRRVASVKELQAKLEERYDAWLFERLRTELPELRSDLERAFNLYRDERSRRRARAKLPLAPVPDEPDDDGGLAVVSEVAEPSGLDSFFAWFFRGDGPDGFLSGAALKKRFERAGSAYSTFFEDNYVAWLLGARPGQVFDNLVEYLARARDQVVDQLRRRVALLLPAGTTDHSARRLHLFMAAQAAALELIHEHGGRLATLADLVLRELQVGVGRRTGGGNVPDGIEAWLDEPTFFTELRTRPRLRERLWPEPKPTHDPRPALREQELRRLLLSGVARLGHAFLDLYVLALQRIRDLEPRARDDDSGTEGLIGSYLDHLEAQRNAGDGAFTAFHELSLVADAFDLILDVNRPELRTVPMGEAAREIGRLLGSQQPIGGMFGSINATLVRQFRLPGYPFVLITTDLLQEGEDLHTFCSEVYHYGISWMPSSMEQRIGRIDRVNSHTERRLLALDGSLDGMQKLQVYYPHLRETVEVLQVRRVLERMKTFARLMHRELRQPDQGEQRVHLAQAMLEPEADLAPITEVLESAFPVRAELLRGDRLPLAVPAETAEECRARFASLKVQPVGLQIDWEDHSASEDMLLGTVWLADGRRQPFTLVLRSIEGRLMIRCVSPVGRLAHDYDKALVRERTRSRPVQVGAVWDDRFKTYNLNVEAEVLLGPAADDARRALGLMHRVAAAADELERELLGRDEPLSAFRADITQESPDADH